MRYYKTIIDDYIVSISTNDADGVGNITESEYNEILDAINNKPTREGYDYRLRADLTWEEYEVPPVEIDENEEVSDSEIAERLGAIL